jgi:hypothetical protein
VAAQITARIRQSPASEFAAQLARIFEDPVNIEASREKCARTPEKCCQKPETRATCEILPEELRKNALIDNIFRPDVQLFRGPAWAPVPRGQDKDAMTVGIGFSAVPAIF